MLIDKNFLIWECKILKKLEELVRSNALKANSFGAVIKFDAGADGVICIDGTGESVIVDDIDRDSDTTLVLTRENLEKLLHGKLNPAMAVMTGKIKVKGDMNLALKLATFL